MFQIIRQRPRTRRDVFGTLYLARKNLTDSDPVIIPYKVLNIRFMTLFGMITRSLYANYSCAKQNSTTLLADREALHLQNLADMICESPLNYIAANGSNLLYWLLIC